MSECDILGSFAPLWMVPVPEKFVPGKIWYRYGKRLVPEKVPVVLVQYRKNSGYRHAVVHVQNCAFAELAVKIENVKNLVRAKKNGWMRCILCR